MGLQDSSSFSIRDDGDPLLKAIFISMLPPSIVLSSYQGSDQDDGDSASLRSPDLKKQKGIHISHQLKPYDYFRKFRTWLRPPPQKRGEASWSVCVICRDDQPSGKMKRAPRCGHFFCEDCIRAYVGKQENIHHVKCPEEICKQILSNEECRGFLPQEVADRWSEAMCLAKVLEGPKHIKCPFVDCLSTFVDDGRGFLIRACPKCWKIFCTACRVRWHMGLRCYQYKALERIEMRNTVRRFMGESTLGLW